MSEKAKFITKDFAPGETLFTQGEEGNFIFIIMSGKVDVTRETNGKKGHVASVSSGDILGEMAVLTDEPRCASAVAAEPTRVIMVNDRSLRLALVNNDLPILKPLMNQLIMRIKEAEQQVEKCRDKIKELEQEITDLKQQ